MTEKIIGLIPARYQSSRFPGKPLALIHGKSLIQRTYEQAKKAASLEEVVVATDDHRIFDHVTAFGGKVLMTHDRHLSGSERLVEAAEHFPHASIIVNLQGDEPCLNPKTVDLAVAALLKDTQAVVSTAVCPLTEEESHSPAIVKCVIDKDGRALYFSRSLIPGNKQGRYDPHVPYLRHIGLYVYRREFLLRLPSLHHSPLSIAEDLEQLKILENGYKIHVIQTKEAAPGVDLPEDIAKIEKLLCRPSTFL